MAPNDETLIVEAGRRLADAAPGARVILFGSRARGEARPDSDLDLLVIEPGDVTKRRAESARLRLELRNHGVECRARWSTRRCERAVSSSMPDRAAVAAVLTRKAQGDAMVVRKLTPDPEIADDIIGFHAQQAVEKWLKAVIAVRGLQGARIHDIGRLLQRRADHLRRPLAPRRTARCRGA